MVWQEQVREHINGLLDNLPITQLYSVKSRPAHALHANQSTRWQWIIFSHRKLERL